MTGQVAVEEHHVVGVDEVDRQKPRRALVGEVLGPKPQPPAGYGSDDLVGTVATEAHTDDVSGAYVVREPVPQEYASGRAVESKMSDVIKEIEKEQLRSDELPEFGPGDTIKVLYLVREGTKERIQAFEGVCIARKHGGVDETFTVRKISSGIGVERIFPLHAPTVSGVEVIRRGRVRRAKLYYLRGRRGKAARIPENRTAR